jgi:hypothetical protein
MSGYATYVIGREAFFSDDILDAAMNMQDWRWSGWRMSYNYQSLWRNLHVDGFEGYLWNQGLK